MKIKLERLRCIWCDGDGKKPINSTNHEYWHCPSCKGTGLGDYIVSDETLATVIEALQIGLFAVKYAWVTNVASDKIKEVYTNSFIADTCVALRNSIEALGSEERSTEETIALLVEDEK